MTGDGAVALAILGRVDHGPDPGYPVAGRTRCTACPAWVWVDAGNLRPVMQGEVHPVCRECAVENVPGFGGPR